jgi:hypothetical protein
MSQRGEEEVAEAMSTESPAGIEAVLKELGKQGLVLGERDHTVADVAGGKHREFPPQPSGAAAVVRNGYHRRDLHQRRSVFGMRVFLEPAKQCGKTGAATYSDNSQGAIEIEKTQRLILKSQDRTVRDLTPPSCGYRRLVLLFTVNRCAIKVFRIENGVTTKAAKVVDTISAIQELGARVRAGGHSSFRNSPNIVIVVKTL